MSKTCAECLVLAPNGSHPYILDGYPVPDTEDYWKDMQIEGIIEYRDVFGKLHQTLYQLKINWYENRHDNSNRESGFKWETIGVKTVDSN